MDRRAVCVVADLYIQAQVSGRGSLLTTDVYAWP